MPASVDDVTTAWHAEGAAARFAQAADGELALDQDDDEDDGPDAAALVPRWQIRQQAGPRWTADPGQMCSDLGFVLLPRLVSIQIFEIQSLAGYRLPHGGPLVADGVTPGDRPMKSATSGRSDTPRVA